MQLTKKCFGCKQEFRKEELVDYASPAAKQTHSYCVNCLREKQDRDNFSIKVCQIFGLKVPGPRIWTERMRLKNTYGYTDSILIDALDYIYNVEHRKKLSESLCLITPSLVSKMLKYKQKQATIGNSIAQAYNLETTIQVMPVEEKEIKKTSWEPDDWLDD